MDDHEQQEQECEVLESILGEELFEFNNGKGKIKIEVNLPNDCLLIKSECSTSDLNEHKIQYLPHILFEFTFSLKYPSSEAPNYLINCDWLSETQVSFVLYLSDCKNLYFFKSFTFFVVLNNYY